MKIVKWIVIVVAVLLVVFFGGAMFMPSAYKVERTTTINAPAEKIYPLVATPRDWPKWAVWFKREPNMPTAFAGAESGKGARWSWTSKDGRGEMEFVGAEPPKRIDYILAFPDMGMNSKGAFTFTPDGAGTKVAWSNEGDVGSNPLMRWCVPFMDKMMAPDFDAGLAGLKALAEKS